MKISLAAATSLWIAIAINAQTSVPGFANQPIGIVQRPEDTAYAVTSRDADSRVWERTTYEQDSAGQWVPHVHSYTELATGLHYLQNGQWTESKEEIDLLPTGGAQAVQGRHHVYFPPDIYSGVIEIITPDGQHLKSRPVGISYYDGTNSVLIAELTNSIGQLISSNQVIYTNAFTDFAADVLCTYRKSGFECDLVFREQPPKPETFGLDPANTRIELLTEFFDTPQPVETSTAANPGTGLRDSTLRFGTMTMVRGKAFDIRSESGDSRESTPGTRVTKTWGQANGRTFLIEEVPIRRINSKFQTLPIPANTTPVASGDPALHKTSISRLLPPNHIAVSVTNSARLAQAKPEFSPGVVLDYNIINSGETNFIFQGDTTYLIDGTVFISGNTTFEGGTVLKYGSADNSLLYNLGDVICETSPYRPAVFTSSNDNSIGEEISGSTGIPDGEATVIQLDLDGTPSFPIKNIRFSYASIGLDQIATPVEVSDCQFIDCALPIFVEATSPTLTLKNDLIGTCAYAIADDSGHLTASATQITADATNFVSWDSSPGSISLTNSIIKGTLGTSGITSTNCVLVTSLGSVFQSVGAGNYYLADQSPYRNAGTTNISAALLAELAQKTTYPPILYSNVVFSNNLTLNPQAQRDYDTPDLGYHYDPIDYLVDLFWITNATLVVTNGAVIAGGNDSDVIITDGSTIVSVGTPLAPNWFTRYSCVQEQPIAIGEGLALPSSAEMVNPFHSTFAPAGSFRFTKFTCPAAGGYHLVEARISGFAFSNLFVEDCEFWSGTNDFSGNDNTVTTLKNNLFARSGINTSPGSTNNTLVVSNNLFWNLRFAIRPFGNSNTWFFFNNVFDNCTFFFGAGGAIQLPVNGYNAYLVNTNRLNPTNVFDIVTTNDIAWQSGPLGTFYLPSGSALINVGSTNANLTGLYHYTTTTNFYNVESNTVVDIGYHYIGVDSSGNPLDTDGDGTPDYIEDANGNGVVDSGETDWQSATDLGLRVFITRPKNNSLIP